MSIKKNIQFNAGNKLICVGLYNMYDISSQSSTSWRVISRRGHLNGLDSQCCVKMSLRYETNRAFFSYDHFLQYVKANLSLFYSGKKFFAFFHIFILHSHTQLVTEQVCPPVAASRNALPPPPLISTKKKQWFEVLCWLLQSNIFF